MKQKAVSGDQRILNDQMMLQRGRYQDGYTLKVEQLSMEMGKIIY